MSLPDDLPERLHNIGEIIFFASFFWGLIDSLLLVRYKGRLNRGFTIWQRPLREDEYAFFSSLKQDILEMKRRRWFTSAQDFVKVKDGEVLVRYSNLRQGTSWPLVGYVDLSRPDRSFEYRLSLPMLVALCASSLMSLFIFAVLSVAFLLSFFFEYVGMMNFLAQKMERRAVDLSPFRQG